MPAQAPPPWLMFLLMVCLISAFLAILIGVGGALRVMRGESFWPRDEGALRVAGRGVRSTALKSRFSRTNGGRTRSARPNAETSRRPVVQAFTDRSTVQSFALEITSDIPVTIDEVQRLAHTIALYAKRPNKELAIIEAWGATKGEGELYARASRLFDTAMSDKARQAAKAKAPIAAREVEAA